MKKSTQKGRFIVFGGCEGSGKSTQIKKLKEEFPEAVFTREPGGSPYAEKIRETMLKAEGAKQASGFAHLCLALASCDDALRNTVAPSLKEGKVVFSDRSALLCSLAYEVFGYERPELGPLFDDMSAQCLKVAKPDLYVIFDVDISVGMKRVASRKKEEGVTNHFDERGADFHQRVKKGYLAFAKKHPKNVRIIDANKSPDEMFADLLKILKPYIS